MNQRSMTVRRSPILALCRPLSMLSLLTVTTLGLGLTASPSWAVQQWNVSGVGDWFSATNWTPSGVPHAGASAQINNGGTASATAGGPVTALLIDAGKNGGTGYLELDNVDVQVQGSLDLGDVEATFATGGVHVTSSGSASLTNAASLNFGLAGVGDINVGQTSAANDAVAQGTATLHMEGIGDLSLQGDLDLGQTSGNGQATGSGSAEFFDFGGLVSIGGDLDVGQTSATVGGINFGTGNLNMDGLNELWIGADMDIGQTTGEGQSTGTGTATLTNVDVLTIRDSLDVAKIRAFNNAANVGVGKVSITGSTVSIGFGSDGLGTGSVEISRVLTSEAALGQATGVVRFVDSNVDIANDLIVGELALGGPHADNFSNATLEIVDSKVDTRDLSVATQLDGTAGAVRGLVDAQRSLIVVQSLLQLSEDASLRMHIDGTSRSIGDGGETDYAAIDADEAVLDGTLEIVDHVGYVGPSARGAIDEFQLLNTLFGVSGSFSTVSYNAVGLGTGFTYVGDTQAGEDGLFVDLVQTATDVVLRNYLAIPGDANGDQVVDVSDFNIWNANKFLANADWSSGDFNGDGVADVSDFNIWNSNKFQTAAGPSSVPEPQAGLMALLATCLLVASRRTKLQAIE